MMQKIKVSFLVICSLFIFIPRLYAEEPFYIVQAEGAPDQAVSEKILNVVYSRLDIPITMVYMPSKRALLESRSGRVDGTTHRILAIGSEYPELIRVPTPINYIEPTVFSKKKDFTGTGVDSIKNYRIGIMRGARHAELFTKDMQDVIQVKTPIHLMELLSADRIDIVILSKLNGLWALKELNIESIYPSNPPLSRLYLYHYLHKKNHTLVAQIDKILQEMEKSGELERLRDELRQSILDGTIVIN